MAFENVDLRVVCKNTIEPDPNLSGDDKVTLQFRWGGFTNNPDAKHKISLIKWVRQVGTFSRDGGPSVNLDLKNAKAIVDHLVPYFTSQEDTLRAEITRLNDLLRRQDVRHEDDVKAKTDILRQMGEMDEEKRDLLHKVTALKEVVRGLTDSVRELVNL